MSVGTSVGRFIGNVGAYTVHGACVAVNATGQFGRDVVESTSAQYAVKSAELKARRDAVAAPAKVPQRKLRTQAA